MHAPVSRADLTDVAAAFLLDDDHSTGSYDVTGPALMTITGVAEHLSEASREPVTFVNETLEEAYASGAHFEVSAFELKGRVASYRAIALGEMAVVTDSVERIAGHRPVSLRTFLDAQR